MGKISTYKPDDRTMADRNILLQDLFSHLVPRQHSVVVLHVLLQCGPAARDRLADCAPEDGAAAGG